MAKRFGKNRYCKNKKRIFKIVEIGVQSFLSRFMSLAFNVIVKNLLMENGAAMFFNKNPMKYFIKAVLLI